MAHNGFGIRSSRQPETIPWPPTSDSDADGSTSAQWNNIPSEAVSPGTAKIKLVWLKWVDTAYEEDANVESAAGPFTIKGDITNVTLAPVEATYDIGDTVTIKRTPAPVTLPGTFNLNNTTDPAPTDDTNVNA